MVTQATPIGSPHRRIVVGFSGGVTSAWCLGWALREYPRDEVVALFHDTKSEDEDTYRFIREMAAALGVEVTERSDGRSVAEVENDEEALANNRMAFCSRILKVEPRERYFTELRLAGVSDIVMVLGFSADEWPRVQRATASAERDGYYSVRFPVVEGKVSKQQCADWCKSLGVTPPRMYGWSDHANCVGCRRGGRNYWLAVRDNAPDVYEEAAKHEESHAPHTILNGISLRQLAVEGVKRVCGRKEAIDIGPCECGT